MNIYELKKEKEKNFKDGLKGFLKEYQLALDNPNDFKRHSKSCGNQAGTISEAFCKYMILNSDKSDTQKKNHTSGVLKSLIQNLVGEKQTYLSSDKEKEVFKGRLERILEIRNEASHDSLVKTTIHDLDEIKNNLLYFSEYLFGKEFTDSLKVNGLNSSSNAININGDVAGVGVVNGGTVTQTINKKIVNAKNHIENIDNKNGGTINFN